VSVLAPQFDQLPQETIAVDVCYYNSSEAQKLHTLASGDTVDRLVQAPLLIPTSEFAASEKLGWASGKPAVDLPHRF
jgi:hypothetical protein